MFEIQKSQKENGSENVHIDFIHFCSVFLIEFEAENACQSVRFKNFTALYFGQMSVFVSESVYNSKKIIEFRN